MDLNDFLIGHHISPRRGFVLESPVNVLKGDYFPAWKAVCDKIVNVGTNRAEIDQLVSELPQIDFSTITTYEELRFAKLLIETIVSAYLFIETEGRFDNMHKVPLVVPDQLAAPLQEASSRLGMQSVTSFASITLANVRLAPGYHNKEFKAEYMELLINRRFVPGASRPAFEWFIAVTAEIEACFAPAIVAIARATLARTEPSETTAALLAIKECCLAAKTVFKKYYQRISPAQFYGEISPLLWGYDQVPNGVRLGHLSTVAMKLRGASASESSAMPTIDVFLQTPLHEFQKKMDQANRLFMPGGHRDFIEFIEFSISADADFATGIRQNGLYADAMAALCALRSEHVNLVFLFVAGPMRAVSLGKADEAKMLMAFLKAYRDCCKPPPPPAAEQPQMEEVGIQVDN